MSQTIIVHTNSGPVRGRRREGATDATKYYSFHRIPYAKAPVGERRFKAPQKIDAWTEVRDCTEQGPVCYQPAQFRGIFEPPNHPESEDCLYVNFYKKQLVGESENTRPLPVLVMIHGGGFVMGSSNEKLFSPDFLLEHDILYVSVNYRLGTFGFLSLPDPQYDIPGNAGLKDQSMALRWVKENCTHFGGDAENITIMGLSAGGASVHYHLMSAHSENLFHRAIVQSGSALNSWASRQHDDGLNERLARSLGWSEEDGAEAMVQSIVQATAQQIADYQQSVTKLDRQGGLLFSFVPTVEPYDNGSIFIDRELPALNRSAWGHKVPLLIGGTTSDGYMNYLDYVQDKTMFEDNGYFDNALPRELGLPAEGSQRRELGAALRRFYYGEEKPSVDNFEPYVKLLTDKQFWYGLYAIVKARVESGSAASTYLYNFDYASEVLTMMQLMQVGRHVEGAPHGEDMLYQFRMPDMHDALAEDSVEVQLRRTYNSLCASFAATGKPSSDATDFLNWEPVNATEPFKCINISKESRVVELPNADRMAFWHSFCKY